MAAARYGLRIWAAFARGKGRLVPVGGHYPNQAESVWLRQACVSTGGAAFNVALKAGSTAMPWAWPIGSEGFDRHQPVSGNKQQHLHYYGNDGSSFLSGDQRLAAADASDAMADDCSEAQPGKQHRHPG